MSVTAILTLVSPFLDRIFDLIPNEAEREKKPVGELSLKLIEIEADQKMAQVELNKAEAQHKSVFVAGWRPFIGWVGGFALAWTFILQPLCTWVAVVSGYTGTIPELDTGELMTLVMAMLGVGAMRSFDKMQGTETSSIGKPKTKPSKELDIKWND